jgi:sugar/nucleoside kinase (ribokinase family)
VSKPFDVTAIGSAIVDILAPVDDQFLLTHSIAKGVMTLIDEYRAQTLREALPKAREIAGGSAANTMAGLASLGAKGAFLGKVKRDRLGDSFAAGMMELGLHYSTKMADDGPATACCVIAVTPDGERSMNTYLGANREFSTDDVDEKEIANASVLYIEGYLWDARLAKNACLRAIEIAKRAGTKVAFTISDPFVAARYRTDFIDLLRGRSFDIVFANEDEAKSLFEVQDFDDVLQHIHRWGGIGALTRSEKGCVIAHENDVHVIDAAPVAKVIDTTGAGDQFAAGFLSAFVRGKSLADCGRLGSIAAAEVISHIGARPETSLKTLAARAGLA